ncbi:serine/threonine-protein kinase [Candidatus Uabimicrobium sp. HlEnr_7]|uniref:serine/threonine-protein kinase n=1 Tax=Candidatus Uabimicrobium helgolandensis TaxID=3095367 RepID=UPI0035592F0F
MKAKCPQCQKQAEFSCKDIFGEDSSCIWNLLYCIECGHVLGQAHIIIEKDLVKIATKNFERKTEKSALVSIFEDSVNEDIDETFEDEFITSANNTRELEENLQEQPGSAPAPKDRITFLTSQELKNDREEELPKKKIFDNTPRSISNNAEISEDEKAKAVFSISFLKQQAPPFFQLDKEKIIRPLSGGGMAETYLYQSDFKGHDEVVVKIVKASDQFFDRFKREVRVHSALEHRNIITTLEAGARTRYVYLITEYADGGDLQALIKRKGRLSIRTALGIGMSVANALNYGWREKALIHRDVKPANILLDKSNKIVKLSDFGLAKFVDEVAEETKITHTGISLGTPCFCSPEQIHKFRDATHLSDIYSIGCLLYHMVTGIPPYALKLKEYGISYFFDTKLDASKLSFHNVPSVLKNIICTCMQYEPDDRYQDYEEFIDDMKNFYILC